MRWFGVMLVALLAAVPAFSQTCALCYAQAASSGARLIAALRSGIVVLMAPPLIMSVAITVMAYRKRNQFHRDEVCEIADESEEWSSGVR